jgi:plasmid stabilization system protein ParE
MQFKIFISEAALFEFEDAVNYYNNKKVNLGNEFAAIVNSSFQKIAENPNSYQIIFDEIRHFVISRFPYNIYYKINNETNTVIIVAVFNANRNPKIWQKRK